MRVGLIGCGKLGLPVAVCLAQKHQVVGYDVNPNLRQFRHYEHRELGPTKQDDFQDHFHRAVASCYSSFPENLYRGLSFVDTICQVADGADIIFLAVQTPHGPEYEGITRLPPSRADFSYKYLVAAAREISQYTKPEQILVVISTCLPGTIRREVLPVVGNRCKVVYNPFFIAMGQVMYDFTNPEFVLLGGDDVESLKKVEGFYKAYYRTGAMFPAMVEPPIRSMSIESAELTKVAYNTYLSMKVTVANALMEVCHKVPGCNIDDVTSTLKLATDRIISPKYMDGGMGDGGGCHPRDNIAMSWLANRLHLSSDMFGQLMYSREKQTEWLANLISDTVCWFKVERDDRGMKWCTPGKEEEALPVVLLGKSYKPETNLTVGSPALLLAEILRDRRINFVHYDPHVDNANHPLARGLTEKALYFIATKHEAFRAYNFPRGSVVLDPFRYLSGQDGVMYIPIGVGK